MEEDEFIQVMHTRFTSIINELHSLGEIIPTNKLVRKILSVLPGSWESKVNAITEAKDLQKLTIGDLIGNLKTYEMKRKKDLERREPNEERNLVLKVVPTDSSSDESEMTYLTRRFQKMDHYKTNIDKAAKRNLFPDRKFKRRDVVDNMVKQALADWGDFSSESEGEDDQGYASTMVVDNEDESIIALMAKSDYEEDNEEDGNGGKGSHNKEDEDGEFTNAPGEAIDIANRKTDLMCQVKQSNIEDTAESPKGTEGPGMHILQFQDKTSKSDIALLEVFAQIFKNRQGTWFLRLREQGRSNMLKHEAEIVAGFVEFLKDGEIGKHVRNLVLKRNINFGFVIIKKGQIALSYAMSCFDDDKRSQGTGYGPDVIITCKESDSQGNINSRFVMIKKKRGKLISYGIFCFDDLPNSLEEPVVISS
uniref:Uncharacterized protein n=1 Tax=Nicotiana tabacum TaxID=4097 RepID=A0A1S4BDR3_TOBAC|nr:PREDICTED: uncharacterized protein LOC107807176 [Nicotiana tabacum]